MPSTTPEVISIKRYPNRRLYDRQARRYITLQDLEALVMEGKKIEVRDSKTGEDLTRAILTQILLERHPERMEMFPVAMLHGILQANDMVLDFFRAYLRQSVAVLEQLQQPTPQATFLAPVDWMRAVMPSAIPFTAALPSTVGPPSRDDLNLRIFAMEERIKRLERPAHPARKVGSAQKASLAASVMKQNARLDRLDERLTDLEGDERDDEVDEENEADGDET